MPEEMMNQQQMEEQEEEIRPNAEEQNENQFEDYDDESDVTILGMKPKTFAKVVVSAAAAGAAGKALIDKTVQKIKAKSAGKTKIHKKFKPRISLWEYTSVEVGDKEFTPEPPKPADPEQNPNQETANNEANS